MTPEDELNERLARVRARFAAGLDGKIGETFAALEKMSGGGETVEIVVTARRQLHEMCGIAPTLGFAATGEAARSAETVLGEAAKSKRALTPAEISAFKAELANLRKAATGELQNLSNRK